MARILAYHGIEQAVPDIEKVSLGGREFRLNSLRVRPEAFGKQMEYLYRKGFRGVGLEEVLHTRESGGNSKIAAITFDDGFGDFYSIARHVLQRFGHTATVFLVAGKIAEDRPNGFLTWRQVQELRRMGFRFGAHTLSHPFLTSLGPEEALREIADSKRVIEERLQEAIDFFSYPFGDFNPRTIEMVKQSGFSGAVVTPTRPGVEESAFTMKRVGINRANSMLTFKLKLRGDYDAFRDNPALFRVARLRKRILTLARETE